MNAYHDHPCDFCSGTVKRRVVQLEPIRVNRKIVILDGVVIGKCDRCGHRYFPMKVLRVAEELAKHPEKATRTESIPVATAS